MSIERVPPKQNKLEPNPTKGHRNQNFYDAAVWYWGSKYTPNNLANDAKRNPNKTIPSDQGPIQVGAISVPNPNIMLSNEHKPVE